MQLKNIIFATVKHLPLLTKLLLMLVTSALIPLMFPSSGHGNHYDYAQGSIWRNDDLVAPFDFPVQRTPAEIEQQTNKAKAELTLYYHIDPSAHNRATEQLSLLAQNHKELNLRALRKTIDSIYSIGYIETPSDIPDFEHHNLILLECNIVS